ncbi:MAG: MCP four helix bundle domain-containing protein [[Clostridium] scindens]
MKTEKKRFGIPGKGLIAVCILAIIVSASSIITTYRMQKMASIIYEHPYTVSNESRATRSRLLDMRFFIMSMFTRPDWSEQDLQQLLNERYEMQYHSIGIISRQYLGPKEDADRLQKAMEALEKTQNEALPIVVNLDEQETIKYVEANLYPKYDAVNDALETIIDYADKKVQNLEKRFKRHGYKGYRSLRAAYTLPSLLFPAGLLERTEEHPGSPIPGAAV